MPLVVVSKPKKWIPEEEFSKLMKNLPEIVADALACENPDGKLTPENIEVWVREPNKDDIGSDKLQVLIFANRYPEREANLYERQKAITDRIKEMYRGLNIHGWVWVRLAPSSFGEF